ncbi:MAG: 2-oxoglutarate dehydrogenase complex dihydrolipoyllysine-residue succinyltransferase, partial [Proteobacteria bacterium]|nr:2-oxoglutarate dehydrogenase complex dihydrolipoyllysine-residue succinyltransferase [Pseudomonadota bacterium]
MKTEVKVPSVGESVKEAILVEWFKQDGDSVEKDDILFLIETDKVTLEVTAEASGVLSTKAKIGDTVAIDETIGFIDGEAAIATPSKPDKAETAPKRVEEPAAPSPEPSPPMVEYNETTKVTREKEPLLSPSVRRLAAQKNVDVNSLQGSGPGGRVTKADIFEYLEKAESAPPVSTSAATTQPVLQEETERKPMSPIRRKIAEHLLAAKHGTAMLTTFNEIDMSNAMNLRARFKEQFKKRHEVGLGFMSFFVKASVQALKEIPQINAFIDQKDILFHNYYHVGVAVGSPKGLVVPVIRHADQLGFAGIEQAIIDYVAKIKENRLELSDMEGGTFTITNGGVFGSLLSTPILNSPQSAILGMHKIEKRPVVVDDEIVIRPMMYVALSYDHR